MLQTWQDPFQGFADLFSPYHRARLLPVRSQHLEELLWRELYKYSETSRLPCVEKTNDLEYICHWDFASTVHKPFSTTRRYLCLTHHVQGKNSYYHPDDKCFFTAGGSQVSTRQRLSSGHEHQRLSMEATGMERLNKHACTMTPREGGSCLRGTRAQSY